ncbi:VCBS repeat-containing protein [soil metagenome]
MSLARYPVLPLSVSTLLALTACDRSSRVDQRAKSEPAAPAAPPALTSEPLALTALPAEGASTTLFTELDPASTGITFTHRTQNPDTHPLRRLYASSMVAGGVAIADLNGDGQPDIFLANGPDENALYLQTSPGSLTFTDITTAAGVGGDGRWGVGVAIVDIDNDGDNDIYVCNYDAPNQLFINDGADPPTFTDRAAAFGLDITDASLAAAFCDYDLDGDLDLYLVTNRYYHEEGSLSHRDDAVTLVDGLPAIAPEFERYLTITDVTQGDSPGSLKVDFETTGRPDYLLRNDLIVQGTKSPGTPRFTDVTYESGIRDPHGQGNAAVWWDFNLDGLPDLFVANDFDGPDHFFMNNGDGTFINLHKSAVPHLPWFSMGADFADIDANGWPDLLGTDMSGTNHFLQKTTMGAMGAKAEFLATADPPQYMRNALYLNTGTGYFMESAYLSGIANTNWTWSPKLRDFDLDGRPDLIVTNGMSRNFNESDIEAALELRPGEPEWDRHLRAGTEPLPQQNLAFRNAGDLTFENTTATWLPQRDTMSFASAVADLDRDGDLDIVIVNLDEPVSILRNNAATPDTNAIVFRLTGTRSHPSGLGSHLTLTEEDGRTQTFQLVSSRGFLGGDEPLAHFGLGTATVAARIAIRWPSGTYQEFDHLAANRLYTIREPDSGEGDATHRAAPATAPAPAYSLARLPTEARHTENPFDDFASQPLLPNKLSQLGPGIAVSDINGDGHPDFFLGGAAGFPGQIFLNDGEGAFTRRVSPALESHADREDMGAVFFDADGDGHPDLYVVSGSAEVDHGSVDLLDRLYINDGSGNFTSAPEGQIPNIPESGGAVVAGDFDRDGDLDLFVTGRVTRGRYPFAPSNRLLANDGHGRFTDVSEDVLGDSGSFTGLTTAALWSDFDSDGWPDLVLAIEWGTLRFLRNEEGRGFTDVTPPGLPKGWWNSVAAADVDGDGDLDYFAGNVGLNTKYHASPERPTLLFAGDMDGSGTLQLVEAEYEDSTLFPVRGRSCSTLAIPMLADKFSTFRDFALAPLSSIYGLSTLDSARRLEATELSSGIFLNNGDGTMGFVPLPTIAQISPVFGAAFTEFNGDGIPDLILAQNSFAPQPETGRMDGGIGQLLTGVGDGTFEPVPAIESGITIPGDAQGLALADTDGDGLQDLLVSFNNGPAELLARHLHPARGSLINVRLVGRPGNPTAVGAHVTARLKNGSPQTSEIYAGSGYLSQSTPTLVFGIPAGDTLTTVEINWPDGDFSTFEQPVMPPSGVPELVLRHPALERVSVTE